MNEFVAYKSNARLLLYLIVAMAFCAGGLWMAGMIGEPPASNRYSPASVAFFGWTAVVIFGGLMALFASGLVGKKDVLRIGPAGIVFRPWSDMVIPWSEIVGVTPWEFGKHRNVVLSLRNPERFPGKQPAAFFARANRSIMPGDVPLQLTHTDQDISATLAAIDGFRS